MIGWLYRMIVGLFNRSEKRWVILIHVSGMVRVRPAYKSESGWISKFWSTHDEWVLLHDDGSCTSDKNVIRLWMPHSGWKDKASKRPSGSLTITTLDQQ